MKSKIHHLAVWVLVVVHFFIGLGWYSLLGEVWLNYHARTMTDIEREFGVAPYLVAIVAAIFANYALAWLIYKLHAPTALAGLRIALICFFGFLFMQFAAIAAFSAFETNPWPLVFIDMGRAFIAFAISGLVLGAWRKREL